MSSDVVITAAARTPIGGLLGALSQHSAPQLGGAAIRAAVERAGAQQQGDEVVMGCVLSAGVGMAPARQATLAAGLDESTPAATVNKVCGSGMKALMIARDAVAVDPSRTVVAGGMESMSNAPHLLNNTRRGYRIGDRELIDHMFVDGLRAADGGALMGEQAQMVADRLGLTRDALDELAIRSLSHAQAALSEGRFKAELTAVDDVTADELPPKFQIDRVRTLKPAFGGGGGGGTLTAAPASSIADGAAALVVTSTKNAARTGTTPLARIVATAQTARRSDEYTIAPVDAIRTVLEKAGWSADEVDLYEINEAFASVALISINELNLNPDRVNVNGGACALGHPIGCSGARIVVTLLHAMKARNAQRGIAAICIGGGEATALAVTAVTAVTA